MTKAEDQAVRAAVQRLQADDGHDDWASFAEDQQLLLAAWPSVLVERDQLRAHLAQRTAALRAIRDLQVGNTEVSYNAIRNLARAALEVTP